MKEKVKAIADKVKQRWKEMGKKVKVLLGAILLAIVAAVVIFVVVASNQPYVVLFSGLKQSDQSAILAYFSENGITDYQVEGDAILVPESQKPALMARVLETGYPSSGYDYGTYLNNVSSLTTESERNQLMLYDLQDYMAEVIGNMDGVELAEVILTPGEDHTYVLDSGNTVDATAAVHVTMKEGKTLTDNQVSAIRSLVSHGLQGLNVENVVISDAYGNPYIMDEDFSDIQDTSALKLKLEEEYNSRIRTRVMQVLLPLYGEGNVQVSVNTVVNVERTYTDSTDYALEDWAEGNDDGIIGDRVWENSIIRDEGEIAGGEVGTETNADLNTYVENQAQPDGTETAITTSGQENHLVDTTKQQVERTAAYIADVMVSVSINQTAAGNTSANDLYAHVGRAAGISDADQRDKISILISPFFGEEVEPGTEEPEQMVPMWVLYAAAAGLGVFLILLIVILLLVHRRRVKKRKAAALAAEAEAAAAALAAAQMVPQQANIMEMQTEKSMELRQDIRKFAEENPEIAAQMVKNWLREGEAT